MWVKRARDDDVVTGLEREPLGHLSQVDEGLGTGLGGVVAEELGVKWLVRDAIGQIVDGEA